MLTRWLLAFVSLGWIGCAQPVTKPMADKPMATVETAASRSPGSGGINDRFLDPELDPEVWVNKWEVESREVCSSRDLIVEAVGLSDGDHVADVGSGTGLFVGPFSEAVGASGKVYALDISPKFVEHVEQRSRAEGLTNVQPVLSLEVSLPLPPNSVDIAFVCDTYHHFEYYPAMLRSIHRTLKPGGFLIVIDFERIPGVTREWILGHVRAGKAEVTSEILAEGFELIEETDVPGLEENYFLRFRKS